MTYLPSNGADAPHKSYLQYCAICSTAVDAGLVLHPLLSASDQVAVLRAIDETGAATIGKTIDALAGHRDPAGAIVAMVQAGVVKLEMRCGIFDEHALLTRATPKGGPREDEDPDLIPAAGSMLPRPPTPSSSSAPIAIPLPQSMTAVAVSDLLPSILLGDSTSRREFAHLQTLRRPGVYILRSGMRAYLGMGTDVSRRVSSGTQRIEDVDQIAVITEAADRLSENDALVLERILYTRIAASGGVTLVNGMPDGSAIDPVRYRELNLFAARVCDALAQTGYFFPRVNARMLLAGPRVEARQAVVQRLFNQVPEGEVMELSFGLGLNALAARRSDSDWLLLRGSDVRPEVVASASASSSYLRAAWLASGVLEPSHDGKSYVMTRDVPFSSASAAMHFVIGSKGQGRGGWQPIDPPDGHEPQTSLMIAS
jgi:hypothetical protein